MTDYFQELRNTFKLFVNNLNIFLFIVIYLLIFLGFAIVAGLLVGILYLINGSFDIGNFNWTPGMISIIVIEGLFLLAVLMIAGSYTTAMTLGFLKEVVTKGKGDFGKLMYYGNNYWSTVLGYGVYYIVVLVGIPGAILAALIGLAIITSGALQITLIIISLLLGLLFILYLIGLYFTQFFAQAIIIFENTTVLDTFKRSYHYLKNNPASVFASFGIILLISVPLGIISLVFSVAELIPGIVFITTPIESILNFALSMITMMYILKIYSVENNIKK